MFDRASDYSLKNLQGSECLEIREDVLEIVELVVRLFVFKTIFLVIVHIYSTKPQHMDQPVVY